MVFLVRDGDRCSTRLALGGRYLLGWVKSGARHPIRSGKQVATAHDVRAQLRRARLMLAQAGEGTNPELSFTNLMASTYFARSAVQLMRATAERGGLVVAAKDFDRLLATTVPRERLIRGIRNRDIHESPIRGLGYARLEHSIRVPPYGQAEIEFDPWPPPSVRVSVSDGSQNYKYFFVGHGFVQDHLEPRALPIAALLVESLGQLDLCITEFERLLRPRKIA